MTISPAMSATYHVGLGSFALAAASTAREDSARFFGFLFFDSGIRRRA